MLKENPSIGYSLDDVYQNRPPNPQDLILPENPLTNDSPGIRPNSASVDDTAFGDSAKGHIEQELNAKLKKISPTGKFYSKRYNGTRNAGHEIFVGGKRLAFHQLPVASVQEGATAIMGKGMLVHPEDLVTEIAYIESSIGAALPGTLLIDQNAPVTTNLHSAFETFTNKKLDIGHGATGSGVAQGYSSWYEKRALTMRDLAADNWREKFAKQYHFYADLMGGSDNLSSTIINLLTNDGKRTKRPVGTLNEFLDSLEAARTKTLPYVADVRYLIEDVWKNQPDIPFTFEGAQGGGLDPYHGVYPDITASRPIGRIGIPDSTEGVVDYAAIALKIATLKNPYMSSVGARIPPYAMNEEIAKMYRTENDETGRSTGRDRGIYPLDLVAMSAIRDAAGYKHLAVTHLDSNHEDIPIEVVTHYVNKLTGQIEPYRPYQWHWDQVEGKVVQLPSWDGKEVAKAKCIEDLPPTCLQFLKFMSQVLAPVAIVTNGPELGKSISFF